MKGFGFNIIKILCLFLFISVPYPALSFDKIKIISENFGPPHIISFKDNKGIDPEIIALIYKEMSHQVTFEYVPFRRYMSMSENKDIDGFSAWEGLNVKCHKTQAFRHWENIVYLNSNRHSVDDFNLEQLKNIIVAHFPTLKLDNPDFYKNYINPSKTERFTKIPYGLRLFLKGVTDALIGDIYSLDYYLVKEDEKTLNQVKPRIVYSFPKKNQFLCFRDKKMADRVNEVLARPDFEVKRQAILRRYRNFNK